MYRSSYSSFTVQPQAITGNWVNSALCTATKLFDGGASSPITKYKCLGILSGIVPWMLVQQTPSEIHLLRSRYAKDMFTHPYKLSSLPHTAGASFLETMQGMSGRVLLMGFSCQYIVCKAHNSQCHMNSQASLSA